MSQTLSKHFSRLTLRSYLHRLEFVVTQIYDQQTNGCWSVYDWSLFIEVLELECCQLCLHDICQNFYKPACASVFRWYDNRYVDNYRGKFQWL